MLFSWIQTNVSGEFVQEFLTCNFFQSQKNQNYSLWLLFLKYILKPDIAYLKFQKLGLKIKNLFGIFPFRKCQARNWIIIFSIKYVNILNIEKKNIIKSPLSNMDQNKISTWKVITSFF